MTSEIIPIKEPRALAELAPKLPVLFLPDEKTAERFFDFFTANIRNKHTRRAYYKAACRFADWCEGRGLAGLAGVKPFHIAAYIEELQGELAKPSVKDEKGGTLEKAQAMANHSSPRTTKLYDRRNNEASLDDYELVGI